MDQKKKKLIARVFQAFVFRKKGWKLPNFK